MNSTKYDIAILTEKQYVNPNEKNEYIDNVLLEDQLIINALEDEGFSVLKTNWDNDIINWSDIRLVVFRSIWDYHIRFPEFENWLEIVSKKCLCVNSMAHVLWNIDKHYLHDLELAGINIVPTKYILKNDDKPLKDLVEESGWTDIVLKPTISGAARDTYKITNSTIRDHESVLRKVITKEDMMIQPFIKSIETKGELSMMVFGGIYSHTVLKKAKPGDFRVQDDHGGTVHDYHANEIEISFAEGVVKACKTLPLYARVDIVWDNEDQLALSELEIIEPELWFRRKPDSANELAKHIKSFLNKES